MPVLVRAKGCAVVLWCCGLLEYCCVLLLLPSHLAPSTRQYLSKKTAIGEPSRFYEQYSSATNNDNKNNKNNNKNNTTTVGRTI